MQSGSIFRSPILGVAALALALSGVALPAQTATVPLRGVVLMPEGEAVDDAALDDATVDEAVISDAVISVVSKRFLTTIDAASSESTDCSSGVYQEPLPHRRPE